jgi:thiamine biosynthesis protein ThiI
MTTFIVRYAEIALKGQNRGEFIHALMNNIREALGLKQSQVVRQMGQVLVRVDPARADEAREKLSRVFGVAWFAPVVTCATDLDTISAAAYDLAKDALHEGMTFALSTSRAIKSLPFTSRDVNKVAGGVIDRRTGASVDLDNPDVTVHISVRERETFIYLERIEGPGGLPVGTNGRVLSLISGGYDSIASSYLLAKRGAHVDFLHVHVYPRMAGVLNSKMPRLWNKLSAYTRSGRVFLANYAPFQLALLGLPGRLERYELIAFRRLMVRVGERLAEQHSYDALVLGDSLGQVASQTMANIVAVDRAVDIPIFRPLIGWDKVDIVNLVESIDLQEEAVARYKDCCSIIARHPATQANMEKIEQLEATIDIESIVDEIAARVEIANTDPGAADDPAGEPARDARLAGETA